MWHVTIMQITVEQVVTVSVTVHSDTLIVTLLWHISRMSIYCFKRIRFSHS